MKKMAKEIEKIMKIGAIFVAVTDYSNYDEEKGDTSSSYRYSTIYIYKNGGWEKSISTSSEFSVFCDSCGSFSSNCDCEGHTFMTTEEVVVEAEYLYSHSDCEVEFEFDNELVQGYIKIKRKKYVEQTFQ